MHLQEWWNRLQGLSSNICQPFFVTGAATIPISRKVVYLHIKKVVSFGQIQKPQTSKVQMKLAVRTTHRPPMMPRLLAFECLNDEEDTGNHNFQLLSGSPQSIPHIIISPGWNNFLYAQKPSTYFKFWSTFNKIYIEGTSCVDSGNLQQYLSINLSSRFSLSFIFI